ncbi:interferon regulatory factor 7 [Neosynchiropus ocellatus]
MQRHPKPQFASWLIDQVRTGEYAGLYFVEPNKFRVPWKHNSRKDCNDEDCKIFWAWAVASGKIREFPNNKARWKTNFRCALNNLNGHFKLLSDNSKNQEDPHKVYEIVQNGAPNPAAQESYDDLEISPEKQSPPVVLYPSETEHDLYRDIAALNIDHQQDIWAENNMLNNHPEIEGYSGILPENNVQVPVDVCYNQQVNLQPAQPADAKPNLCDLEISIHYRKTLMEKFTFNAARVQLHYDNEAPELNVVSLCFPNTDRLVDRTQIDFTKQILNSIQRGLLLEVLDTGIYATRQDRCRVFASTGDPTVAQPSPQKLPQNTPVQLLSFEDYANELKKFKENRGRSPRYIINMCFGESFPDGRPLEKKLIVVQVVPLICRYFHEVALMEGASSLHNENVSLQFSHNSLEELIHSVFGLPMAVEPFPDHM